MINLVSQHVVAGQFLKYILLTFPKFFVLILLFNTEVTARRLQYQKNSILLSKVNSPGAIERPL